MKPTSGIRSLLFLASTCIAFQYGSPARLEAQSTSDIPEIRREFRGIWVATVGNIDWPSRPGLSSWEQQEELIAILNRAVALHMNAIVFQVRPAADAVYSSKIEPWAELLAGQMGVPPQPEYDPLKFAIDEAHKRGLELHAWFNPYRARYANPKSDVSATHIAVERPELVRKYGSYLWMDPGDAAVRKRTIEVVVDIVRRYDVDGVHIDDYFYPYIENDKEGKPIDFPDSITWRRYVKAGGKLSRPDWRRSNVDSLVHQLYEAIKETKPTVKFGVSPFGIWRPGNPEGIAGLDAFTELYANSKNWLNKGWLDYLAPQLYWHTRRTAQSYSRLLEWWVKENTHGRHIWAGNFTSRVGTTRPDQWDSQELLKQIELTRAQPGASGNIHFSAEVFQKDPDSVVEKLKTGPYADVALVPASKWLDARAPLKPTVTLSVLPSNGGSVVDLDSDTERRPWLWTVRTRFASGWTTQIVPGWVTTHYVSFRNAPLPEEVFVTAVDRSGNESPVSRAKMKSK
jgi:uncharacterized lipoprotein YddW (UPF0748 family)